MTHVAEGPRSGRGRAAREPAAKTKVAYLVSRFPKLTETFVVYELLALEAMGVAVELYPLLRTRQRLTHPEAAAWVPRARPWCSLCWPV